jgi:hypothetical protein
MTFSPSSGRRRCAMVRVITSPPPPEANGTMIVIGRDG